MFTSEVYDKSIINSQKSYIYETNSSSISNKAYKLHSGHWKLYIYSVHCLLEVSIKVPEPAVEVYDLEVSVRVFVQRHFANPNRDHLAKHFERLCAARRLVVDAEGVATEHVVHSGLLHRVERGCGCGSFDFVDVVCLKHRVHCQGIDVQIDANRWV